MIRITRSRTIVDASPGDLASAREKFLSRGYLKLPGLIESSLLASLLDVLDRTEFRDRVHDGIGTELCAEQGSVSTALEFLMNDPGLVAAVSRITDCSPIGCFEGRVYRLVPQSGHYDSWHSDVGQDRLIAVSVNLGRRPYQGGMLQIRRASENTVLSEVENKTTGDAVMFRIHPSLRHRVGPVMGSEPRTAYAGWYRTVPQFRDLLRERLRGRDNGQARL